MKTDQKESRSQDMRNIKIRLPDEDDSPTEGSCCGFAYKEGWNACIGEVTRLNAVPDRDELFAQTVNLIRPMTGGGLMIVSEPHGTRYVPESLLLDARAAEQVAKDDAASWSSQCDSARQEWHSWMQRAERAEALAGEYERDARRYRYLRDHANRISAGPYNAWFEWEWDEPHCAVPDKSLDAAIDTAIDAVGGRVET